MKPVFITLFIVGLSGCVSIPNNTEKVVLEIEKKIEDLRKTPSANVAATVQDVASVGVQTAQGFANGGPLGAAIALATGGFALWQRRRNSALAGLLDDLEKESDPEKCKLLRKGVG